jgi:O-glycosyl hydrolase
MLCAVGLALAGCGEAASPADVPPVRLLLDPGVSHQTITGFGGYGGQRRPWVEGPFADPRFVRLLVDDLGLTVLRDDVPPNFEAVNDNDDPFVTDLSAYNLHEREPGEHDPLGVRLPYLRALHEAGVETFIASVWSPPPWMKHNAARGNGTERETSAPGYDAVPDNTSNQLRRDMFEEFAEMCVAYIRILERETGIHLAAISLQNEPRFSQFYASTVYDPETLRDLIRVVGARFEREGITTRILMPEDTGDLAAIQGFVEPALADPEARRHVGAIAVHGYAFDGITPEADDSRTWQEMAQWGEPYGLPLWMTETSGFADDWDGAMRLATAMYTALRYGDVSAWLFWRLGGGTPGRRALIGAGGEVLSKRYFVSRNVYRFVRPGDVRVELGADDPDVLPLAFRGSEGRLTLILINLADEAKTAVLDGGPEPPHWERIRTSATEDSQDVGPIPGGAPIDLPARSVTTLVAGPGGTLGAGDPRR